MTIVSVQPTFYCKMNCNYCYLGDLRKEREILDLRILRKRFESILTVTNIDAIDIFGGEISLLNLEYLRDLFALCFEFCPVVNISSNLSNLKILEVLKHFPQVNLSLSWNKERPDYYKIEEILNHKKNYFKNLKNKIQILTVALPSLLNTSVEEMLGKFESWNLPVTILRYFPSTFNASYDISISEYENFIIKVLETYLGGNYTFLLNNYWMVKKFNLKSPLLSSNIFIQPSGDYSWINYQGQKEIYLHSDKIESWLQAIQKEKMLYKEKCSSCPFYNRCLAEHLNFNDINKDSCCGLKNLLMWWFKRGIYFEL